VENITATCFGGRYDKGDSGETESGISTIDNPNYLCALPIRSIESATRNSPLAFKGPHIPWFTIVSVWRASEGEETAIQCKLVDNGPDVSRFPTHALDITSPAAHHFSPDIPIQKLPNVWSSNNMSYRIHGGAKWIS
jgi:hypothetical protein